MDGHKPAHDVNSPSVSSEGSPKKTSPAQCGHVQESGKYIICVFITIRSEENIEITEERKPERSEVGLPLLRSNSQELGRQNHRRTRRRRRYALPKNDQPSDRDNAELADQRPHIGKSKNEKRLGKESRDIPSKKSTNASGSQQEGNGGRKPRQSDDADDRHQKCEKKEESLLEKIGGVLTLRRLRKLLKKDQLKSDGLPDITNGAQEPSMQLTSRPDYDEARQITDNDPPQEVDDNVSAGQTQVTDNPHKSTGVESLETLPGEDATTMQYGDSDQPDTSDLSRKRRKEEELDAEQGGQSEPMDRPEDKSDQLRKRRKSEDSETERVRSGPIEHTEYPFLDVDDFENFRENREKLEYFNEKEKVKCERKFKRYSLRVNQRKTKTSVELDENVDEIRVAVIGKTGHGKSSTANSLLGKRRFKTGDSNISETDASCVEKCTLSPDGPVLIVMDSPGLKHTKRTDRNVVDEMTKVADLLPGGVHVFLYVWNATDHRVSQEDMSVFKTIKRNFGEKFMKHCITVYSNAEGKLVGNMSLDKFISKQDEHVELKNFLEEMDWKIVAVNNSSTTPAEVQRNREELLYMIYRVMNVNQQPYTYRKA